MGLFGNAGSLLLCLLALTTMTTTNGQCTLCLSGDPITLPDVYLGLTEPIRLDTCADVDSIAPFLGAGTPECEGIQSMGTLCGCPLIENACQLCGTDGVMENPTRTLSPVPDTIPLGLEYTCAVVEAGLNVFSQNTTTCHDTQTNAYFLRECGCSNYVEPTQQPVELCTLCPLDATPNLTEASLDTVLWLFGENCTQLAETATSYPLDSVECRRIHNASTLCGCPVSRDACNLCPHGLVETQPNRTTCQSRQASLHHNTLANETQCTLAQQQETIQLNRSQYNTTSQTLSNNNEQYGDGSECLCKPKPVTCNICPNGEPLPLPNKTIDTFSLGLPQVFDTCEQLASAAELYGPDEPDCWQLQLFGVFCGCSEVAGGCRLCPDDDNAMTRPDAIYGWSRGDVLSALPEWLQDRATNAPTSCAVLDSFQNYLYDEDDTECFVLQLRGDACGCPNDTMYIYIVAQRIASGLSILVSNAHSRVHTKEDHFFGDITNDEPCCFCIWTGQTQGSLWVMVSILVSRENKLRQPYHQMVLAMSFHALLIAIGWMAATSWNPDTSGQYKANGSEFTCSFQGFLIQWGQTVVFYHVFLQAYFWYNLWPSVAAASGVAGDDDECGGGVAAAENGDNLLIEDNTAGSSGAMMLMTNPVPTESSGTTWPVAWLRWGHVMCSGLGLVLAAAAIPFYDLSVTVCTVAPPPINESFAPMAGFIFLPVATTFVFLVVTGFRLQQRRQTLATEQQQQQPQDVIGTRKPSSLWLGQSKWYAIVFFSVWMGNLFGIFLPLRHDTWWLLLLGSAFPPLPGFLICIVYVSFEALQRRHQQEQDPAAKEKPKEEEEEEEENQEQEEEEEVDVHSKGGETSQE